jgi:hypothetical protein
MNNKTFAKIAFSITFLALAISVAANFATRANAENALLLFPETDAASGVRDSGSMIAPPVISSISPAVPQTSTTDQKLIINGSGFVQGLTITVTFPNGSTATLSGAQIPTVSPTSISIRITLNAPGTWCLRINNPNGEQSTVFCFTVAVAQAPTISSINPSSPPVGGVDQNVNVSGTNFQAGLTVTVFFPGGGTATLSGSQILDVTPTSLTMVVTLNVAGQYGIRINNPSTLQSNVFNFNTQAVTPAISSIAANCASNVDRPLAVTGTNFFAGLSVSVTFPNGGGTVLQGSQIQNVTSNSFTMVATLADPGMYLFRVINPGGVQSPPASVGIAFCLSASGIAPANPIRGNIDQSIVVTGSNFQTGLVVTLVFPGGGSTTLSGSQISGVLPNSFTMRATLNAAGQWMLMVRNPNGDISNTLSFDVRTQTAFDFDRDGKTDMSIFRPSAGEWWYARSVDGQVVAGLFGSASDVISPGDYTGDGKTDICFFRPSTGQWFVLRSEDGSYYALPFGQSGDIPVPADYDGDGRTDHAIFRPSTSTWFINRSSGGTTIENFGASGDKPVPADYDGDGRADIAIYRPSLGQWWMNRSATGVLALAFGNATDKPVQGDYTGDGKADNAFWRPSTGEWFILRSENFSFFAFPFGTVNDIPAPADYDGDARFDPSVFRPSTATWFIGRTTAGTHIVQFGSTGDRPLPNAFVP